jgi:hypothetical protein
VLPTPSLTLYLAGNPLSMDNLATKRDELYANSRRPGTVQIYESNIRLFKKFCTFFDLIIALSVRDKRIFDIVTLYIAYLCIRGLIYGSIRVYIYSIHTYFMDPSIGVLDITKSYLVSQVLHAVKLKIGD